VLRIDAYQPRDNILKREIETSQLPSCPEQGISVLAYWPLMKGVLAGKMLRPHRFDPTDIRQTSPIFRGQPWQKNQDFLDSLRSICARRRHHNRPIRAQLDNSATGNHGRSLWCKTPGPDHKQRRSDVVDDH